MNSDAIDRMLELCYVSVEKMSEEIDNHAKELNEYGILKESDKINKFFHTLGAATGNFLMNFADVVNQKELIEAYMSGLSSFIEYCNSDKIDEDPAKDFDKIMTETVSSPGSLRVLNWLIDNPTYYN